MTELTESNVWSSNVLILIGFSLCCILLYLHHRCQKACVPKLYCANTELNKHVSTRVKKISSKYSPPLLLRNRHIQIFLGHIGVHRQVKFRREYVHINDGGVVALDWMVTSNPISESSPILLVLPGVTATKTPIHNICSQASKLQYRVVVFTKRGHDDLKLTTPVLQTHGDSRDLRQCVELIHQKYPLAKMAAVGNSAGTGLLCRYLGQYAGKTFISAVVFISSGFNFPHLCLSNISRLYERLIVSQLRDMLTKNHRQILKNVVNFDGVAKCSTIREFDYHVYCKMHGYRDVAEYWTEDNPMKYIHNIDVPVMCINSLDDPICLASNIPYELFQRPEWLLVTTDKGGHSTFIENWKFDFWADKCALDYIDAVLEFQQDSESRVST